MDKQYLVELEDPISSVRHKVWVISPNSDNMQEFIDTIPDLPYGMQNPTVVSVKEMGLRTIRLQLIDKVFPVVANR